MKHLQKFYQLNEKESNKLTEQSEKDLESFRDNIRTLMMYDDLDLMDVLECLETLLKSDWNEIMEIKEHLTINAKRNDKDNFMIDIIDRYCSSI